MTTDEKINNLAYVCGLLMALLEYSPLYEFLTDEQRTSIKECETIIEKVLYAKN